jgi:hypothetical protein
MRTGEDNGTAWRKDNGTAWREDDGTARRAGERRGEERSA